MKKINILYWVFTGLFSIFMIWSSYPDAILDPKAVEFMNGALGYPVYFIRFIGIAKLLGIIAILIPGFPRIKEWAYAGLIFDLIGAVFSIASIGQLSQGGFFMIIPIGLWAASYFLYHRRLKLMGNRSAS